ncbi:MAG: hypothetical protein KBF96_04870 [Ignavibacteria bacterium]|nr:hypothetical protein [Ignavibacteria bacterium]
MKNNFMKYFIILFTLSLLTLSACTDKTDLSQFPLTGEGGVPALDSVTYVQQEPIWTGYNAPRAILLGREPLVYIADTKNNRIVQLDLSGAEIGSIGIRNPVAIAQDYNYDLLVIGDSILPPPPANTGDTINFLWRIKLVPVGGFLSQATLLPLMGSNYPTPLTSNKRKFSGVGVFADNSYILTRRGPDNTSSLDPDNALLKAYGVNSVTSVTSLSGFQVTGNGVYSIDMMSAITTFNNELTDFIITRNSEGFGFKVLWFVYDNLKGTYEPKFVPAENVDILNVQIGTPVGITVDNNKNIYVVDNTKDSLYKYNSLGNLRNESFGGTGSGTKQLYIPEGVSFFNKVLYISDTGNNRIVRYKLSTDLY